MVRAMVGGDDNVRPRRSTSPPRVSASPARRSSRSCSPRRCEQGISPSSTWASKKLTYILKGGERFTVNNYEDAYAGCATLASATTFSDNAVYVQVAKEVGTKSVARLAREMGIRTPVSTNLAIALGGLRQGVTPLDMAHAYETFATGGLLVTGSLSPGPERQERCPCPGRSGSSASTQGEGKQGRGRRARRRHAAWSTSATSTRVLKPDVARQVSQILQTVVKDGTAPRARRSRA